MLPYRVMKFLTLDTIDLLAWSNIIYKQVVYSYTVTLCKI